MWKIGRAAGLLVIRVVSAVRPALGTRLAIRIYAALGMRFEGRPTFLAGNVWFDGSSRYGLITIREGSTVSRDVRVLTHDWSPQRTLWALGRTDPAPVGRLEPVEIGAFAFVGMGAILMPGASLGRGSIVGAGSVVRGKVPDFGIAIGNPATIVGDSREYVRRKFPQEWADLPEVK